MGQIPAKFLKEAAVVSAYPLNKFTNLSVKLFVFPEVCKIVKSLFKKDWKTIKLFHFYL